MGCQDERLWQQPAESGRMDRKSLDAGQANFPGRLSRAFVITVACTVYHADVAGIAAFLRANS
jgi:hypothetical protein